MFFGWPRFTCRRLRLVFHEQWTTEDVTRFLLDWCHRLSSFHPVSGLACYTGSLHTGRHLLTRSPRPPAHLRCVRQCELWHGHHALLPPNAPSRCIGTQTYNHRQSLRALLERSQSLHASGVTQRTVCWRDTHKVSPVPQLGCGNLHRKVEQSIVCRTHDDAQRSASLHVFPQNRHCPLTDEITRGGRRQPHSELQTMSFHFFSKPLIRQRFRHEEAGLRAASRPSSKKNGVCLCLSPTPSRCFQVSL